MAWCSFQFTSSWPHVSCSAYQRSVPLQQVKLVSASSQRALLIPIIILIYGVGSFNKHKPWIETSYHGVITENMDTVLLDPPLVALDKDAPVPYAGEICAFKIYGQDAPFEAVVLNRTSGEGVLRASGQVDCELQKEYTFIIQAYDCGAGPDGAEWKKSHKAVVHIQVDDVNEFSPTFREQQYKASVTEGKIYDSILQVEAWDQDCSPQYSQICNYEIVTAGTPFAIDRNGNIRNTEHLSYEKQQSYKIMVTAFDCGQKRASEDVAVHIDVKPVCKPGWQGWMRRVDYEPGTGSRQLFPKMHLEMCGGPLSGVKAMVELQTNHIGKGCDRETYSEKSLQKLCGAASGSTDILPAPSPSSNWTASLLTDSGRDSDLIYRFDGRQAANIPGHVVPQNLTDQFTIATWMKHGPSPGLRAEKETLLCNSDKTEMNRHHYSLYVHNCRLVFLLRRDFSQVDTFRPAEFHWKLEQICDKEWHYYVINVEFPAVTLFVDGVTFEPYLVTDDWPIHASNIDTQLTVGACWQGPYSGPDLYYFHGSLSGLTIRPGRIETQKVISCLQACKEGLDINSLESLAKDIKFHFNPAQSVLVVEGEDLDSINSAMTKVSYINSRQFPTPGIRKLHITTTVQCFGEDSCLSIPDVKAVVMVMPPSEPRITISGSKRLVRPASDLRSQLGVAPFKEVHITSTVIRGDSPSGSESKKHEQKTVPGVTELMHNLDYCDVLLIGDELNPERESLEIHHSALLGKHLDATNSTSGLSIYGVDSMAHYEQALRQIRYRNWRPATLSERKFRVTCSELNGRYISNEFILEVNSAACYNPMTSTHIGPAPPAATVVIVVCIAALVVIVVIGVYRIHATHQESSREDEDEPKDCEMDWDNSGLTIIVNPMEVSVSTQAVAGEANEECSDEDDEEEVQVAGLTSTDSDNTDEDEKEETSRVTKLKWDSCSGTY
uniref:Calsyntenin-2 n=1 Tax=Neogobius melanostomus TaxID=47308 RepID=A0A8C6SW70_9GOBI